MTIINYTFFSPTGTEFPVSSNADAKLYLMLSGMTLLDYKRTDWTAPVDTALNRQYTNTSIVAAGRYFELTAETVVLSPSSTNYVHVNIDIANATNPVSLSVESTDNSNGNDINTGSGVFKKCIDIVYTDGTTVMNSTSPKQTVNFEYVISNDLTLKSDTDWQTATLSGAFKGNAPQWKCYRGKEVRVNFSNLTNNNQLSGNTPYTIFNLPEGYRPLKAQEDVIIIRVAGSWTLTRLIFNTNGTVQIVPANTIPVNTGFSGTSKISIE